MGVYKKDGNYYIDYYVHGRRKREKVGTSKRLADTILAKRKVEILEGKFIDRSRERKISLSEFVKEYLEFSIVNKSLNTYKLDQMATRNFLKFIGNLRLGEVAHVHFEKYKSARINEVSISTVNRELATLKHMFTTAVKWSYLTDNPARDARKGKEPPGRVRYLMNEEIQELLQECKRDYLKTIVLIALNTGMRKGEILGLTWADVDLENRVIHVATSKNHERRDIPVNDMLFAELKKFAKKRRKRSRKGGMRLFPYRNIRKAFQAACRRAQIKDFRFHDLRHTFASHLVMSGVDLATTRDLLGHKSIEMTLRYSHLSPGHRVNAVNSLSAKWTQFGHQAGNCA